VIRVVAATDPEYPARLLERLGDAAPTALHVAGPISSAGGPRLGVVGSREVDATGAELAAAAGRAAVAHGWGVVSGGALGVDRAAMDAALAAGGTVVGFLADPLAPEIERPVARDAIAAGRLCLASPFGADAEYTAGRAHLRNKLIYVLAVLTLVVATEPGESSTWLGAVEAIEHRYGDVAVWTGAGAWPGNLALAGRGARPITALEQLWRR
jgi:predicted Rossmann fold nucleotide-binding protein DprA/Smf involved in DNA uptake